MIPKYIIIGSDDVSNRLHKILHNFITDNYPEIKIFDINDKLYPNIAIKMHTMCQDLLYTNECSVDELIGIVLSDSYIGMTIVCNKFSFIRCATIDNIDIVPYCRTHLCCNCISLSNRNNLNNILKIFETFIKSPTQSECKCKNCLPNGYNIKISKLLEEIDTRIYGRMSSPK
jgi:ribose 5-phosphate isomerase RpiB